MKLKLIANGSSIWERLMRRWGLAFLIDDDILFDAFGDARVFLENLRRFKTDISKINHAVISHEHWDHLEGLRPILGQRPGLNIYLPNRAEAKVRNKIQSWGGNVCNVSDVLKIKDGIYLSGEIIGKYSNKNISEQSLVLETAKGLIVIAGCAHPGIVTIVDRVKQDFKKSVYGVIGGFHLKKSSSEDINNVAKRLKDAGVKMVVPLHCTGAKAQEIFQQLFGESCLVLREGQELII